MTTPPATTPPGNPQGARLAGARYVSGANPLTAGQSTTIEATYTLTNNSNTVVDYSNTNEFDFGPGVAPVVAIASVGNTTTRGNTLLWGGFTLAPGQTEQVSLTLNVTPSGADAGRAAPLVTDVRTTGVVLNGGFFMSPGDALVSSSVTGLLNGGLVLAAPPPARPDTPVAGGVTGSAPGTGTTPAVAAPGVTTAPSAGVTAARPAAPQTTTTALPRTGTGMPANEDSGLTWMLAALVVSLTLTGALLARRHRSS